MLADGKEVKYSGRTVPILGYHKVYRVSSVFYILVEDPSEHYDI